MLNMKRTTRLSVIPKVSGKPNPPSDAATKYTQTELSPPHNPTLLPSERLRVSRVMNTTQQRGTYRVIVLERTVKTICILPLYFLNWVNCLNLEHLYNVKAYYVDDHIRHNDNAW